MSLKEDYDFEYLQNAAEELVIDELERQLTEKDKICKCQDCILDMAALALNKTKPHYRVSLLGKLYTDSAHDTKYMEDIKKSVKEALNKVAKNPAHD